MKRILVPVDFSSHTDISCHYALSVAKVTGAEIILFHSFFDQIYFSDGGFTTGFESGILLTDEIILDFYRQKELKLNQIAEEMKTSLSPSERNSLNITCRMESGDPEVQILNAIHKLEPDLIVMGSGGMGKKRILSGSVARRIIDNTNIPVIAVPDLEEVRRIRNVVYMTTFNPADSDVITEIDTILAPFHVSIFCLHLTGDEDIPAVQQNIKNLADSPLLKKLEGRISFHILDHDDQQETLRNFIVEHEIDLIAFIPHKRNILKSIFFQGITKEDLFLNSIPIMSIRSVQ